LSRLDAEVKALTDELRAFNTNAEQRLRTTLNAAVEEETAKQNKELAEVKSRMRAEETEMALINRRNQELLNKFQNIEREGKNRLINKKSENARLKEDLANMEQQYNKLVIQLNAEKKETDKKRANHVRLQGELEELQDNAQILDARYNEEVDVLRSDHDEVLIQLAGDAEFYASEQARLREEIKDENDKIYELNRNQQELIAAIESNLNNTLSKYERKEHEDKSAVLKNKSGTGFRY